MTRLRQRLEALPEHRADQFRVAPVREPSNPEEFARFVANVNTQFDAIAQRFAELVPRTLDPTDYVRQDELASLMEAQFNTNDQYLTSAGAEDLGTQSSEGKTSQGRNAIDEAVQALVDGLVAPGVVFAGTSESGAVTLVTDATNLYWDDTNDILHANVGNIIGAGAEATPSLYLAGDSDTGLWHPGDNTLALSCSEAEVMRWGTASVTVNEDGDDRDFRVEGDTLPNLLLLDASADRIFITDAATGGTPPSDPTGGFAAGTLLALVNNSAGGDDVILALIADATSGLSEFHFGDANDANAGMLSYDHATDILTLTVGTNAVATFAVGTIVINEDGDDVDFRVEGDNDTHALFVEGSTDYVGLHISAPQAPLDVFSSVGYTLLRHNTSTPGSAIGVKFLYGATGAPGYTNTMGEIRAIMVDDDPLQAYLAFFTNEDGSTSNYSEKLRISHLGLVRIENGMSAGPAARLHVVEDDSSAARAVVQVDQADVDEPFVKFLGTAAAATLTNSLVAVADVSTATVVGYVKIEIQDDGDQITDGDYYVAAYSLA